jgi:hypothetical protein
MTALRGFLERKEMKNPYFEAMLMAAKNKMYESKKEYDVLRNLCPHERVTWKNKYGGYRCDICEHWFPTDWKPEKEEENVSSNEKHN